MSIHNVENVLDIILRGSHEHMGNIFIMLYEGVILGKIQC